MASLNELKNYIWVASHLDEAVMGTLGRGDVKAPSYTKMY